MKISIVTVSFNSDKTISDTINSVLNQTYNDIEYIVIDGASKDSTLDIIKRYEEEFAKKGRKLQWISEKDNGIYDAINKGIKMSSGEIVGILNSDDYLYDNNVIDDVVLQFTNNQIDCLYGNMKYIDPNTTKVVRNWKSRSFKKGLFEKSWTPGHPTFYCKKAAYNKYGLYRTDFKIAADVELMYRFLEKYDISSYYFDRYLVIMRQGGVSSSGVNSTITITTEMIKAFKINGSHLNLAKYLFFKCLKIKEFMLLSTN